MAKSPSCTFILSLVENLKFLVLFAKALPQVVVLAVLVIVKLMDNFTVINDPAYASCQGCFTRGAFPLEE